MIAILNLVWKYVLAFGVGAIISGWLVYGNQHGKFVTEQAAHAADMKVVTDAAMAAQQKSIEDHRVAAQQIAALDTQLTKEKAQHEEDNARNRAAIASGTRRLRVAVEECTGGSREDATGSSASGMGHDAPAIAVLSSATGTSLFAIADGADTEVSKLKYLQGYIKTLQEKGYIEGARNVLNQSASP